MQLIDELDFPRDPALDRHMRIAMDSRIKGAIVEDITLNEIRAFKNNLSDKMIAKGFVPHEEKLGILVYDYIQADFTNELYTKVVVLGDKGRWKGEFTAYYPSLSYSGLMRICALMSSDLLENPFQQGDSPGGR